MSLADGPRLLRYFALYLPPNYAPNFTSFSAVVLRCHLCAEDIKSVPEMQILTHPATSVLDLCCSHSGSVRESTFTACSTGSIRYTQHREADTYRLVVVDMKTHKLNAPACARQRDLCAGLACRHTTDTITITCSSYRLRVQEACI